MKFHQQKDCNHIHCKCEDSNWYVCICASKMKKHRIVLLHFMEQPISMSFSLPPKQSGHRQTAIGNGPLSVLTSMPRLLFCLKELLEKSLISLWHNLDWNHYNNSAV